MYRKKQQIGGHKVPYGKKQKQGVDSHAPQDIRYTPTPVQDNPGPRFRLESDNRNWMIQDKESHLERHSPDSALTASSNGSSLVFQSALQLPPQPKFSRSQSIPNLFEPPTTPFPPLEYSRKISESPYRTGSLCKAVGPYKPQGPVNVHQGPFVKVRVGPYDDDDTGGRVNASSGLVKNRFKSESNLFDPEVNDAVRRIDKRQTFSVRTVDMKKSLGMFGFVLSCKYVLHDPLVPRELRCFPRIDTVSLEGVAHRSGIRHGHFVLEINRQSVEMSSLNRCTSLLQMGGDHLQLKIASNHQTNEPIDVEHRSKGTTGSNFFRDIPSSDPPRRGVRHRESAVKKRLMASSHPAPQTIMTRANSTPNLADDAHNHIYEELTEPLPEVEAPKTETGRRGSDVSKVGKRPGVIAPPQNHTGRSDTTNKNPGRPDDNKKNAGRSEVTRPAISRMTSLDMESGSGSFPPSPPPRPDTSWSTAVPGTKTPMGRGSNPAAMKTGGKRGDAKPGVVEMKISPGAGITSIASVFGSSMDVTVHEEKAPIKFSSFTGPFKDDAPSTEITPPSHGSGRTQQDGRLRVLATPASHIHSVAMQAGEMGRGRNTLMLGYPGNTSRIVTKEDSGNKETFGSGNNLPGALATTKGGPPRSTSTTDPYVDMDRLVEKSPSVAKSTGDQGGKFGSPQTVPERQRTVPTRMGETQGLLEAIMKHPLMRPDNNITSSEQNSTVGAPPFQEPIAKHEQQKAPPPIPPPPKSKAQVNAPFEGPGRRYPTPGRSTSPTQDSDTQSVRNLRWLKPVNPDQGGNESNMRIAVNNRTLGPGGLRQAPSPQTPKTNQEKGDVAANALKRSGPKSKANQGDISGRIPPVVDFQNPRQNLINELHSAQVFRLDGATVDQSYSEDTRANGYRVEQPAGKERDKLAPRFRFDDSTGRLLLSDATVGESSTEGDLLPLPPPPPATDASPSGSSSTEVGSQDNPIYSWNRQLESSDGVSSSFTGRGNSVDDDAVFLEGISVASPPPPVFFIDPDERRAMQSKHEFELNPLTIPAPEFHHKANQETIPGRFGPWTNPPNLNPMIDQDVIPTRFVPRTNQLHSKNDQEAIQGRFGPYKNPPDLHPKTDQDAIPGRFGPHKNLPDLHSKADQEAIPRRFGPFKPPLDLHPGTDPPAIPIRFVPGVNLPQSADPSIVPLPPLEFQSLSEEAPPRPHRHIPDAPSKTQPGRPKDAPRRPAPTEVGSRGRPSDAPRPQTPSEGGGSISDWSISEVTDWLRQVGLGQHVDTFSTHRVDGRRLSSMTRRDLIELGVTEMTQRRDIERGVIRLMSQTGT